MLDVKEAKQVREYIKNHLFNGSNLVDSLIPIDTLTSIAPVYQLDVKNTHTVLAVQFSNVTILVRIERQKTGIKIHSAQTVSW